MSQVIDNSLVSMGTTNFGFSGASLDDLESSEYTIVTIAVDISSSVSGFRQQLEECLQTIVESCQRSPRSENLLIRLVSFNNDVNEVHGFRILSNIQLDSYDNSLNPRGCTSLYDAVLASIEATQAYGTLLADQDYFANGVIYVITDGADNASTHSPTDIRNAIEAIRIDEDGLESLSVILIGVGYGNVSSYLDGFRTDATIDQFVDMTDLFNESNPATALAKLAGYISRSISTTSMALQNGTSSPASSILLF